MTVLLQSALFGYKMSNSAVFVAVLCLFAVAYAGTLGDSCDNGIPLQMNELYEGDTTNFSHHSIQCNTYKYSPKGVWYTYIGEGKAVVLDTCDQRTALDSVIFVFDSCSTVAGYINSCYAMNDDGCNQQQSRVMFTADQGQTLHIYVAGFLNSTGTYYLATSEIRPPENYVCSKAVEADTLPFSAEGETGTCLSVFDDCSHKNSAGLWYKVHGTGTPFVAHTCNQNTNYDSSISVLADCQDDRGSGCVAYNNDACYRASLVHWRSVMNSSYYIFVTGFNNARGRFTLAIEKRSMNPYSFCYEPIVITAIPFFYYGQTDYLNTTFSECRNFDLQHTMYFRLQGSNRKLVATTCTSSSTVNDSVIDVYSQCEFDDKSEYYGSGKSCVASNDDYCGLGAQVVFFATSDSYYIAVSSASPTLEGVSFSLSVMAYEETKNSQCWYAQDIDSLPDVLLGNTTSFDTCDQSCDGSRILRRGGWWRYTHYGESKTITASTCNKFNLLNARIEIYRDCNEMGCVTYADPKNGCTNATFVAENGKTYNIYVTATDPNDPGGYFHVDFYEEKMNEHGICEEAYFIQRGALPYRVEDSTILSPDSWSSCDNKTLRGVWVAVIGTGTRLVATTCDSHTGYDTVLELYDRCPESVYTHREGCLMVNDENPSCGRSSEIEWASNSGQYYWIFVTGFAGDSGIFVLNVFEKASMINAQCRTAVGIRNLPYYDYGLTTYCDICNASCTNSSRKGNWYMIKGADHWITISTCRTETDFATEIEVYLSCSEFGGENCVAHNHDFSCSPKTAITFAGEKDQLYYIFITGVDEAVAAEGFFGMDVTQGPPLPASYSSSASPSGSSTPAPSTISLSLSESGTFEGLSIGMKILICCSASLAFIAIVAVGVVIVYCLWKRRQPAYMSYTSIQEPK